MLTPLMNSVLVRLFDEVATGAPIEVEVRLDAALVPILLIADSVYVPLKKVTSAAGDVLTEAGLVLGI